MDLRSILEGGAAPPAPPGKGIESPPPPEEFEKALHQAKKGDENPGEVAETEPNAQLQKLDSKENETGKEIPVTVLVEQAVTIPVQFMTLPIVAALQEAIAPGVSDITKTCKPESTPISGTSTIVNAEFESTTEATDKLPKIDEMIASLQSVGKPLTTDAKAPVADPTVESTKPQTQTVTGIANQTLPKNITKDLNVVSVQAVSNSPMIEQAAAAETTNQIPVAPGNSKSEALQKNEGKVVPMGLREFNNEGSKTGINKKSDFFSSDPRTAVIAGLQSESSLESEMGAGTDSESSKDDQSNNPLMNMQGTAAPTNTSETASTKLTTNQLTTADRQKVVDTLTKRIEELSVNSVRNEVRVEMQPAELGSVIVNIRKGIDGMTASLSASNDPLRQALHDSRNELAVALAERNVGQVKIEVRGSTPDTMNMGQQFNQAQSQHHNQQQQPKHAAVNLSAHQREAGTSDSSEQKTAPRRLVTSAFDMEI